ncbi:HAD hydrolase-like protein [Ruicaihuangia caeni]|uniref:HAD hydrolase-like protein n=1 Tax=Ruicaihuangia caeni TaxID=3042517 RepID=A0AAW6TB97_9MICO|nr:HAD hydrolase-like protein [Klugiella sp. YN-L-19]MDI2099248.1 HAD hydrolase-like protein [Klugiella sp. YN-L-19]
MKYTCILLDLDGTITDSAPGIIDTLGWTLEQMGLPVPSREEMLHWVGPPIMDSFRDRAGLTPAEADRALEIYREKYLDVGAYDSALFAGMPALIRDIHRRNVPVSLATSKPEIPATLMLEHFNLAQYFTVITGASADEVRSAKADVVEEALRRLESMGHDTSRPIMVGDRIYDIEGAAAHGIPTIIVDWGYGFEEERGDAIAVAKTPTDLAHLLFN